MNNAASRWEWIYDQVPLIDVPRHFANIQQSPFTLEYLKTILALCPKNSRTLETGIGSGLGAIWLSLRGVDAIGIDYSAPIVERATQINNLLQGTVSFSVCDLFELFDTFTSTSPDRPLQVIHHQGVLEHFTPPQIRAALSQQLALAEYVVFSVPSVYYPFEPEFGDERLLPIEEWQRILKPFDIHELRYYGDNCVEQNEHILAVLKGNPAATSQKNKSSFRVSRFKSGISAIVHTRNEEHNITECLQSLTGWTDQIIVCDMESSDRTRELAAEIVGEDNVMSHPVIKNFDRARNASATRAEHEWVFYLDADERVPPQMGEAILKMIEDRGDAFSGMLVPFRHIFAGHWMQCLYPGYTAPRLFKNGCFFFNPRPHSGAQVDGEIVMFPGDDPNVSLLHNSFTSLSHYLGKLDNYTTSEAANMHRDGHSYSWQNSIRHFVQDFRGYYEQGQATRDGVHGFLYSFLSGFYRFFQHAKLYEHRFRQGQLTAQETNTPANLEEVLQFALNCIHERHVQAPIQIVTSPPSDTEVGVVWTGPLRDPSGYGEESRSLLFSLSQLPLNAGESDGSPNLIVAAQTVPWSFDTVDLSGESGASLLKLEQTTVPEGFIQIIQDLPQSLVGRINDKAGITIARTMFETDRLPDEWVKSLNKFDFVWATSEHGRDAFANSGVHPAKLRVVPGAIDLGQFAVEHSKSSAGKRTATNVRGKCFNSSRFSTGHYTRAGIAFLRVSFKNLTQIQMSG